MNIPKHVAIIMDGNGRWAKRRHLPRTAGHAKGAAVVKKVLEACERWGVECLTLFAFSTENWSRPREEVSTLMGLFLQYLESEMHALSDAGVRLKVVGDVEGFGVELQQRINAAVQLTQSNTGIILNVAANYGGRWDITQAVNSWLAESAQGQRFCEESDIESRLSTSDLPALDLLIRTGGERRVSNFLLWQCAYAELYFTDVLWPDFGERDLEGALEWYSLRQRRFGSVQP